MPVLHPDDDTAALADILRHRYGVAPIMQIERLPIGQGTLNYRVLGAQRQYFMKRYTGQEDLQAETAGIALSETARHAGIPTARVIPNIDGQWIDHSTATALSLWRWSEGAVITHGLQAGHYQEIGAMLGRIHRVFASLPTAGLPRHKPEQWRSTDLGKVQSEVAQLLAILNEKIRNGTADAFDQRGLEALHARQQQLTTFTPLLAGLPALGVQPLHGDYTLVNMLFTGDKISAVLDFRPPALFFRSYELGRIAFSPHMVVNDPNWLNMAKRLITAYREEHPEVPLDDLIFSARVALLQLLKSLYGIKQHYLKPGLIPSDLDNFWALRHRTVGIMLPRLEEIEAVLRQSL
ncbi:phosphotransferase enzyme family protein [Musicola paradisiaca]|uniref:Aminoglycoside phosphotransferase n=1 Tax=Musicola paradisiaca (strain Ech703) TaxID=579405 RepID=C6C6M9_MUSP7|nr:phosphotransferase [Musicola paradisiaca]ACS83948.1 aminoglycoside phosphotransferase [Musicola paradisiaca Ech703]